MTILIAAAIAVYLAGAAASGLLVFLVADSERRDRLRGGSIRPYLYAAFCAPCWPPVCLILGCWVCLNVLRAYRKAKADARIRNRSAPR